MVHPKIVAINAETVRLRDKFTELHNRRRLAVVEAVAEALPNKPYNPFELIEGYWACPDDEGEGHLGDPKSPTGKCIYAGSEDCCIFCGLPTERK
jgi:hypothetical protein